MLPSSFSTVISRTIQITAALLLVSTLAGCKYYYKVQTSGQARHEEIKTFNMENRYLVLHKADSAWHLTVTLLTDSYLIAEISQLPADHQKYLTTHPGDYNRYKKNHSLNESGVVNEVHLYLPVTYGSKYTGRETVYIELAAINKVEVYKKAKGKTIMSWVLPGVGIPLLAGTIGAGVAVASFNNSMNNMHLNLSH